MNTGKRALLIGTVIVSFLSSKAYSLQPPGYWEIRPAPTGHRLETVTYAAGQYVAVGYGIVLTSSNGVSWTQTSSPWSPPKLLSIAYGNGLYVAGGWEGYQVMVSPNAVTWTNVVSNLGMDRYSGVIFAQGRFVGVGSGLRFGTSTPPDECLLATSTNGFDWSNVTSPITNQLHAVTFGNELFVAVGAQGSILTSPDGLSWNSQNSGVSSRLKAVTFYNGNRFIAAGDAGLTLSSLDGTNWTQVAPASFEINALATAGSYLVAVGSKNGGGAIQASSDGINWPADPILFPHPLRGITFANGRWLAIGDQGLIVQSHVPRLTAELRAEENQFVIRLIGPPGSYWLERSSDLLTWNPAAGYEFQHAATNELLYGLNPGTSPQTFFRIDYTLPDSP